MTMLVISTTVQNFIQIGLGVSVLHMRDFAPLGTKWLGYFFWGGFLRKAIAETRLPILTQNTSNDAVPHNEVPLGVAKPISKVWTPIFPQNRHFWAPFRRNLQLVQRGRGFQKCNRFWPLLTGVTGHVIRRMRSGRVRIFNGNQRETL